MSALLFSLSSIVFTFKGIIFMLSSYLEVEHPFLLLREVAEGGRAAEVQQVGGVGEDG